MCFLIALCCLIVWRLNVDIETKRCLHQQVWGRFSDMLSMEVYPYSYFQWCGYISPWVSFVTTDKFSIRVTKNTSRISVW